MRFSSGLLTGLIALMALVGASLSSAAYADSGTIRISVVKAGWFIGASGGSGTLTFHGRQYPLSIGGVDFGLVFGASQTYLSGRVSRISPGLRTSRAFMVPAVPAPRSVAAYGRSC